jgi:peptidyl-prolyl cis-trans isomerase SurA
MKYVILSILFFVSFLQAGEVVERIVAIVNEEVILLSDVDKFVSTVKKGAIVDDLLAEDPKELLKDREKLIQHLINEKVIESEIKKKQLQVNFEQVEKEISKIAGRNNISRAQLKDALKEQGTNFSDYQDFIKKRLERQALIEQSVTSKIKISDEEIASYYMKNAPANSGARMSYEYKLAHIVFMNENGLIATPMKKAERIIERINGGETFEALASKFSEDPNFSTGGLLGTFKTGEFLKELEEAASRIEPGQISKPVVTKTGVHVLKVLEKRAIPDPKIEAEKERIRQVLYQQAFKRQFSFWLDQRRRDSFVRINQK